MSVEEELKILILSKYKSIREFTNIAEIPYSTLDMALKRGIGGMGIQRAIRICKILEIDTTELAQGRITPRKTKTQQTNLTSNQQQLLNSFNQLNEEGQEKSLDYIDDLVQSCKYKKHYSAEMGQEKAN